MITVTRLNGEQLVVNAGLIEFIEHIPETMISLTTGRKLTVKESIEEVVRRVTAYEGDLTQTYRTVRQQGVVARHAPQEDGE
jgi:flagellar protein FlbD